MINGNPVYRQSRTGNARGEAFPCDVEVIAGNEVINGEGQAGALRFGDKA